MDDSSVVRDFWTFIEPYLQEYVTTLACHSYIGEHGFEIDPHPLKPTLEMDLDELSQFFLGVAEDIRANGTRGLGTDIDEKRYIEIKNAVIFNAPFEQNANQRKLANKMGSLAIPDSEDLRKVLLFHFSLHEKIALEAIDHYLTARENGEDKKAIRLLYDVGVCIGALFPSLLPLALSGRVKGKKDIEKRWGPYKRTITNAVEIARELWTNGDKRLHDEMSDYLLSLEEFQNLTKSSLMKQLKRVAHNFERVRGMKGIKKEKK